MELIDRQAAIDAVGLCRTPSRIKGRIAELPTIDAVPVVRCKDCKHYSNHDKRCKLWNHGVNCFGYCSEGVRKDDE